MNSVQYVSRDEMLRATGKPYFGVTFYGRGVVWVRSDLPAAVRRAVRLHELQHLADADRYGKDSVWKLEARAWWAQLRGEPLGTLMAVLMSLSPERLRLYWERLKGGF